MNRLNSLVMRVRAALVVPGHSAGGMTRTSSMTSRLRRLLPALLVLPALGMVGTAHAQSCAVGETPVQFGFSGGEQTVTVPAGVQSLTVYLSGAQGGAGRSGAGTIGGSPNSPGGTGGLGGRVRGTLAVTPGALLSVFVGGQGSQAVNPGGTGHGTSSISGIGGGGTDLRVGGNGVGNRVGIAGGGGGGGAAGWSSTNVVAGGTGGVGGGGTGGAGVNVPGGVGPFGGGGGAVGTGGAPGGGCPTFPATAGNAANGNGGNSNNFPGSFAFAGFGGGGGGGAQVGAGGGGAGVGTTGCQQNWNGGGGGGAGGSSGAPGLAAVTINNGVQAGNGAALICFAASQYSVGGTASGQTGPVTLRLDATNPSSTQQVSVAQGANTFVFPTRLAQGANWNISVLSSPAGQTCSVNPASGTAIAADVTNVALTCSTVTVDIAPAAIPDAIFGAAYSQTLSASSANGGIGPYTFTLSAGALPAGITLSGAGVLSGAPNVVGTFNFTVQATSSNGFSGTRAYTLVIAQASQTITNFAANPAAPVFTPNGTFTVSATGGASTSPVVFGSTSPSVCTVGGNTVTMLGAGTCALTADQAGDANYGAAPQVTLNVIIGAATQTITGFAANPTAPVFTPNGTFTVSATGGASTSPVVFGSTSPSVCTVGGSTVTMLGAGTCTLTADQAGDANYGAAPQVTLNVAIGVAGQTITGFTATPTAPVFTPNGTFTVSATGGPSTSPVVFSSTSPSVCTVSGSTVTMLGAGTCALTADQAGDANYGAAPQVTLNVAIGTAAQTISNFTATPAAPVFTPNGTFTVSATGGASTSPVVFGSTSPSVCTVGGSTVTMLGAGTCALTADQAGDANYGAAPQVVLNVAIGAATQTITGFAANPAAPVFTPNGTFAVSATGGASTSPVVFGSTSPSVCTVSGSTVTMLNAGTCALTADQAGDANYGAAPQITLNVAIGAAAQTITGFAANPTAPVFTPNGTFTVSATGGPSTSPVVFASTSPSVCTVSGSTVTMLNAGTCTLTADQAGDANYGAAPQVTLNVNIGAATPTLRWIEDLQKSVGETSFDLPDPDSDSDGGFTFSSSNPAVATVSGRRVTIVAGGLTTLVATQAAAGSYAQGTASATLTVSERPDPTRDPGVVSGLQAQVDASVRFAAAQQSNIHDRLRQQRHSDANVSSNAVSLNLANSSGAGLSLPASQLGSGDAATRPSKSWALWSAGVITAGERDARSGSQGFDFRSDGVTIGADWRNERGMLIGLAGGFGWNETDFDELRSGLDADQRSLSVYGLWRPGEHVFVDGLLGWGRLDFDITRWSDTAGATAQAKREGDQAFGSLTLGYEHNNDNLLLTGYGRLDASRTTLDGYRESGLGIYDLAYREQSVDTRSLAVGVEGSYLIAGSASQMRPYWMLEYRDAFENRSDVALNYAVMPNATDYTLGLRSYGDNAFTYGAGLDLSFAASWRLSLLLRREHASGQTDATSFGLLLSYSPRIRVAAGATALSSEPPATGD